VTRYVVTGAASGLGAAVTARLRAHGEVVTVDLRDADVVADLGTPDGRAAALAGVLDRTEGRIDGLVPCAGLGPQVADHALIASVNYFGAVAFLDGCLDALASASPSACVAISSNSTTLDPTVDADLVGACLEGDEQVARGLASARPGNTVYASTKTAVARDVRRRVVAWGARGVRVNAVAPGPFRSPLLQQGIDDPVLGPAITALELPTGPIPGPDEVAAVVEFLLGRAASYVHGAIVFVDGGLDAIVRPDAI
jgi:NAD(P)-dependent dehydrogenase (short-subunit alcohol dehydrogenase family)